MVARCAVRAVLATVGLASCLATTCASHAAATGKCTLARTAEWPVRTARGVPIVDGAINGHKVGIMLDTGAGVSLLMRPAAERLGLVRYDTRSNRIIGVGGETKVETVSIDEFVIGGDKRRNFRMLVAGEHEFGGDVAVILGEDFFRQVDIEFDLAHETVRLFQVQNCEGKSLAYWATEGVSMIEFDAVFGANPAIEFNVEINGKPLKAQLDSGASTSILTKSQAAALGVTPDSPGIVSVGCGRGAGRKLIPTWVGPFESFRIDNEIVRDPSIRFADIWKYSTYEGTGTRIAITVVHPDMLLGADYLRSHRVLIAHSQQRMYFTYAGGMVFQPGSLTPCEELQRDAEEKR